MTRASDRKADRFTHALAAAHRLYRLPLNSLSRLASSQSQDIRQPFATRPRLIEIPTPFLDDIFSYYTLHDIINYLTKGAQFTTARARAITSLY